MPAILLVEDDAALGRQVVEHLADAGYRVDWDQDGTEALQRDPGNYSLVLLDLMLPGAYGLDILKRFRQQADVPVIILSARDETHDKVRGFSLGADDYLSKPFWPEELVARVAARLRRPVLERGAAVVAGSLRLDTSDRSVTLDGVAMDLTRTEFAILHALLRRVGSAVSRAALVNAALDPERQGSERTLDVHVSRLRKKLGDLGSSVETVWGVGYRFSLPS